MCIRDSCNAFNAQDTLNSIKRYNCRSCEIVTVSLQQNRLYSSANPEVLVIFKFPLHWLSYVLLDVPQSYAKAWANISPLEALRHWSRRCNAYNAQDTLSSMKRYSSIEIVTVSLQQNHLYSSVNPEVLSLCKHMSTWGFKTLSTSHTTLKTRWAVWKDTVVLKS